MNTRIVANAAIRNSHAKTRATLTQRTRNARNTHVKSFRLIAVHGLEANEVEESYSSSEMVVYNSEDVQQMAGDSSTEIEDGRGGGGGGGELGDNNHGKMLGEDKGGEKVGDKGDGGGGAIGGEDRHGVDEEGEKGGEKEKEQGGEGEGREGGKEEGGLQSLEPMKYGCTPTEPCTKCTDQELV